ncbi:hypothetical protein BT96DRAFT_999280 [Gymnopus androsaceus JB14]|uniref:Integral membrane protein n=1 Tax=Gymnopus androsaceus JB14 TaxID=1447944 RepID=A0A6A4H609_9AGAR|nr:hypothetical protein BT96DRAFT_999280 [Gymnopus androsaceus JB14]
MPSSPSALIPLLTTTASLSFTIAEFIFISPLVRAKSIPPESTSAFWDYVLRPGLAPVVVYNGTSTAGAILSRKLPQDSFGRTLVGWGTLAAFAHFAFGYNIARVIESMIYKPATAREGQKRWLKIHALRTLTTDIPAFACFLAAVYCGV